MSDDGPSEVVNPRLDEAEIEALARHGTRRTLRDGESLFRAGEQRGGFYVVLRGEIHIIDAGGARGAFGIRDVRSGSVPRVSSAVGEGAMAIKFVHAHLAEGAEATDVVTARRSQGEGT